MLDVEVDRVGRLERCERRELLPEQVQGRAGGGEDLHAGCLRQHGGDDRRRRGEVLQVVHDQQEPPTGQPRQHLLPRARAAPDTGGRRQRAPYLLLVGGTGQGHEPHPVRQLVAAGGDGDGEP
ncbi:hypothetical protein [Ornithinimicrobium sp. W1665]|uniref:hypothetical protein n=1 Tax=Ornithinimicrobium sp. W1665 TaxID=3416666 RepID=UPI003D6C4A27